MSWVRSAWLLACRANCEGNLQLLFGKAADVAGNAHRGNSDRALADADVLVERSHRSHHIIGIQQRLTHPHEHYVADAPLKVLLNGEHLIDNFIGF